eukprot:CAMPEP_0113881968 /NCGR_PEP_ID=MMETSP0780_2-20120614/8680_1 /TAXON_ID=652834 /ORGANISM="Palpitomonas bilix" /LENGTH=261 /DNA_ID=CAMNT_0000868903 /DNA_START=516 /DNA_END=1301 /DNA_ORIENTATION=+ /assembly_acc=CAM_ASM_000599
MGNQQYVELREQAAVKGTLLPATHHVSKKIATICAEIVRQTGITDFQWEVSVIDSNTPNAMCLPGGKIIVTTGIIDLVKSDSELALVLAHEIAHVFASHGQETLSMQYLMHTLFTIGSLLAGGGSLAIGIEESLGNLLFTLPKSREMEFEADFIGLVLLARTCYDISGAFEVFRRLNSGVEGAGEYSSTHPSDESRAKQLEAVTDEIKQYQMTEFPPAFSTPSSAEWYTPPTETRCTRIRTFAQRSGLPSLSTALKFPKRG